MSTITVSPRGFRLPPLFVVLSIIAAVVIAAVVAFALNTGSSEDAPAPARESGTVESTTSSSANAAEHSLALDAPLYQDNGAGPGRPYKDGEISDPGVPPAPGLGAGSNPRGADNYALR